MRTSGLSPGGPEDHWVSPRCNGEIALWNICLSNTSELDRRDGGRVIVERLLQAVVLLQVEDVDQSVPAG